jgi:hypothetical protein
MSEIMGKEECKEAGANVERLNKQAERLKMMVLLLKFEKFVGALLVIYSVIMIFLQPEKTPFIILGRTLLMCQACLNWLTSTDSE